MKPNTHNIWRRAALMTILGTTICSTALGNEATLPSKAIPNLKLPSQIEKEEDHVNYTSLSAAVKSISEKAIDPNVLYADSRLPNPYKAYIWRRDVTDDKASATLPTAFRTSQDFFKNSTAPASREGLENLQVSGSAQPTLEQYEELAKVLHTKASGPIYVVDLRQETHAYVNDEPLSLYGARNWGNVGKNRTTILQEERQLLTSLPNTTIQTAHIVAPSKSEAKEMQAQFNPNDKVPTEIENITVEKVQTEEQVAKNLGLRYLRLTDTDHIFPNATSIDQFITFYKTLPSNAWLHFHCEAGKGRTTTFMILYDILRNPQVPLEEILKRQHQLGGIKIPLATAMPITTLPNTTTLSDMNSNSILIRTLAPTSATSETVPTITEHEILPNAATNEVAPNTAENEITPNTTESKVTPNTAEKEIAPNASTNETLHGTTTKEDNSTESWKDPYNLERSIMIQKFYRYVQQNYQNNFNTTWSYWLNPKQPI